MAGKIQADHFDKLEEILDLAGQGVNLNSEQVALALELDAKVELPKLNEILNLLGQNVDLSPQQVAQAQNVKLEVSKAKEKFMPKGDKAKWGARVADNGKAHTRQI